MQLRLKIQENRHRPGTHIERCLGAFALSTQRLGANHGGITDSASSARETFPARSRVFDEKAMGYTDNSAYLFNTITAGNSNSGHDYGTKLSAAEKRVFGLSRGSGEQNTAV